MTIAVTYDAGAVFQHFGHTERFKLYEIEDGKVASTRVVETNGTGHGALSVFLIAHGADIVICGGIGGGAQTALARAGIKIFGGVHGDADEAVRAYLSGTLDYDPEARCDHHDHGEGHECH